MIRPFPRTASDWPSSTSIPSVSLTRRSMWASMMSAARVLRHDFTATMSRNTDRNSWASLYAFPANSPHTRS